MMLLMAGLMVVLALSSGHLGHGMMEGQHGPAPGSQQSSGMPHESAKQTGTRPEELSRKSCQRAAVNPEMQKRMGPISKQRDEVRA